MRPRAHIRAYTRAHAHVRVPARNFGFFLYMDTIRRGRREPYWNQRGKVAPNALVLICCQARIKKIFVALLAV